MSAAFNGLLTFTALLGCVAPQGLLGDICTLEASGDPGICQLFSKCEKAEQELRKYNRFPQTCGSFQGRQPVICCPRPQRQPHDISKKKCKEYENYVYELKQAPTLTLDSTLVKTNECGQKVVKLIIGGEPARRKEFPHMAAIGYEVSPGEVKWSCGGTILSDRFVLTAAHCLRHALEELDATHVRLGVANLTNINESRDMKIAARIAHPKYVYPSNYHDIGLLKLEEAAKLDSFARPACLYSRNQITAEKAIATGWGDTTVQGGSKSDYLMKVELNFVDYEVCNNSFKTVTTRRLSSGIKEDVQICAGSANGEMKDTCQGDSGGPLQIFHAGDDIVCMYDVVGITSFGKFCSNQPSVFVRVSHYIKWIEDVVWPEES